MSSTEEMIQKKGLTAPRLRPSDIDDVISTVEYSQLTPVLTVCVLTLRNGFIVTGESACASPENFDQEIGEKIAYDNARDKIWQLEGYLLKQRLYEEQDTLGWDRPEVGFGFGIALEWLQDGMRAQREGWNGECQWLELQKPDAHSKTTVPYFYIRTVQGDLVPWLASRTDMLARDWRIMAD